MEDVLSGFFTIWFVIGIGWLLAQFRVLDAHSQRVLSQVSFWVGLPALLFGSLRRAELGRIFSQNVIVSLLAIFITLAIYPHQQRHQHRHIRKPRKRQTGTPRIFRCRVFP